MCERFQLLFNQFFFQVSNKFGLNDHKLNLYLYSFFYQLFPYVWRTSAPFSRMFIDFRLLKCIFKVWFNNLMMQRLQKFVYSFSHNKVQMCIILLCSMITIQFALFTLRVLSKEKNCGFVSSSNYWYFAAAI